ncbi:DUF6152 family protein [Halomonas maura]|uniref:DUF6152 family protein n=1 Tax=Halomonas maura TaxID=117606 RepID=UPI0025B3E9C8|nr:DUF6152 family protein [Halomonas maura]MDN3555712.1 DUF6152 family protein [Halomonas maura]
MLRRPTSLGLLLALLISLSLPAQAHHGWAWAEDEPITLSGTITAVRLGNPHGDLTLDVDGTAWTVEVGQPWRNRRAGLEPGDLAEGIEIRVLGAPSRDADEKRLKAVQVWIDGEAFPLYPDRL